jgi:outer membrane receptor for ferrienterochelin and colicin
MTSLSRWTARATIVALGITAAGVAGCRTAPGHVRDALPKGGQYIGADEIAQSNARSVWDALRLNVKGISFLESGRTGAPARVRRRGTSSLTLRDEPQIYIDEVRISDLSVLRGMPASDVESIRVLSGIEATTYYGSNTGDGVILIRTRSVATR